MKFIISKKEGENKSKKKSTKLLLELTLFAFSLTAITMLLFFVATEGKIEYEENSKYEEYVSVFKESYLYDAFDMEYCENEKTLNHVSTNSTKSIEVEK